MVTVIKHAPHEGLGTFERILRNSGQDLRIIEAPEACEREWHEAASAPILIVMGGAMGVYEADRYDFLRRELGLLRERIAGDQPTLGICLGAQLIAQAGGSAVRASGRREIGWYHIQATAPGRADPLFRGLTLETPVFHWHGDTFDTPPQACHLATSERFLQQGIRLGKRVYGLQFHPEVGAAELPEWLASEPGLAYGLVDGVQSREEILAGGQRFAARMEALSCELIGRLLTEIWH